MRLLKPLLHLPRAVWPSSLSTSSVSAIDLQRRHPLIIENVGNRYSTTGMAMKTLHTLRNVALTLLLLVPGMANAWWNDQWPYRLPIALDASATGANLKADVGEATVLVKLHTGNFEDFFSLKEDLADIRFVADDDKTQLEIHVEHADLINQLVYIWVKVPQIAGAVNTGRIWMYYGNETATAAQDAGGSFDVTSALALHFGPELGKDATANANNAAAVTAAAASGAQIAGGAAFDAGKAIVRHDAPSRAWEPDKREPRRVVG